jgi:hypothetical protein
VLDTQALLFGAADLSVDAAAIVDEYVQHCDS